MLINFHRTLAYLIYPKTWALSFCKVNVGTLEVRKFSGYYGGVTKLTKLVVLSNAYIQSRLS